MKLSSTAFDNGGMLRQRFTCDGAGLSPPLQWNDAPNGVQSFALICEDPDAPSGLFTHWLLYNIPAGTRKLEEGLPIDEVLSIGARQGRNSFGQVGYGGACPPKGDNEHRYVFKLLALDTNLNLEPGAKREQLLDAIRGHSIAEAELTGKYKR